MSIEKLRTDYESGEYVGAEEFGEIAIAANQAIDILNNEMGQDLPYLKDDYKDGKPFVASEMNDVTGTVNLVIDTVERIRPKGEIIIGENGEHDITGYETAIVEVPIMYMSGDTLNINVESDGNSIIVDDITEL